MDFAWAVSVAWLNSHSIISRNRSTMPAKPGQSRLTELECAKTSATIKTDGTCDRAPAIVSRCRVRLPDGRFPDLPAAW